MKVLSRALRKKQGSFYRRKWRIRKRVTGSTERPRLSVKITQKHIYAQLIDDTRGCTLCAISTMDKDIRGSYKSNNCDAAAKIGENLALRAQSLKIVKAVFDRNGRLYHGRIRAVADGARKGGLQF